MDALKCLGVVSLKAGRSLLYKVHDVGTMFQHWRVPIPEFIKDMVEGKVCVRSPLVGTHYSYG